MNILSKWLGLFSTKLIQVLCLLFFVAAAYYSFKQGIEMYTVERDFRLFLVLIIGSVLALAIFLFFINRFLSNKLFLTVLIALAFTVRLIWVLNIQTPIESDFYGLYTGAVDASNGDFSFSENGYFSSWVYQLGFTMYQALIITLFGDNVLLLKLLGIVYSVGITVLIYLIGKELMNETAGRLAGIFYAVYVSSIVMTSVLTNDHLSTLFYMIGFYLIVKIKQPSIKIGILIGLFIGLGNIIRPLGSLILIAILLYYVVYQIILAKKGQRLRSLGVLSGIFVAYFLIMNIVSYAFIAGGVTEYPLSNRAPYWKFLLGLNQETIGRYSSEDARFMSQFPLGEERDKVEKELILERISDKEQVVNLFYEKFKIMWGTGDSSINWSMSNIDRPFVYQQLKIIEHATYFAMLLFSFIFLLINRKKLSTPLLFLLIVVLGYVMVHFFIEIQQRYRFFIIPIFAILAGGGFADLMKSLHIFNKKIADNEEDTGKVKVMRKRS